MIGDLLGGFVVAFSLYSALPMPRLAWTERNMRYTFCFFPLIGLPAGGLLLAWGWLCGRWGMGDLFFAVGAALLSLLVTGGIHMDGFCDTVDALASHQEREKKLAILKDPHTGAFAVMACCGYLLAQAALYSELPRSPVPLLLVGAGYLLSRTLSALAVVSFRCAKDSGLVHAFADQAARRTVGGCLMVYLLLLSGGLFWLDPVGGGAVLAAAAGTFLWYRVLSYREFGGITGDLAGWFLQCCELAVLAAVVLVKGVLA